MTHTVKIKRGLQSKARLIETNRRLRNHNQWLQRHNEILEEMANHLRKHVIKNLSVESSPDECRCCESCFDPSPKNTVESYCDGIGCSDWNKCNGIEEE